LLVCETLFTTDDAINVPDAFFEGFFEFRDLGYGLDNLDPVVGLLFELSNEALSLV
jgi:hypothetical protein